MIKMLTVIWNTFAVIGILSISVAILLLSAAWATTKK
jgi:hypothetical protein